MNEITHDYCMCDHKSHKIVLLQDGSVATPDHPEAADQGRRLAAFARLGKPVALQGCATVVALAHGADILCPYWSPSNLMDAPAPWKRAVVEYRSNNVIRFAMVAALAKHNAGEGSATMAASNKREITVSRLMVELGKCSWFRGQSLDLTTGLRSDKLKEWGEVGPIDRVSVVAEYKLRIPLQSYWLDLADNGRIVYNDRLIVGEDADDPRTVYAIHRDPEAEQQVLRVSAFKRNTRMERLEKA